MNTMKNLLIKLTAFVAYVISNQNILLSQSVELGFRYMPTFTNLSINTAGDQRIEGSATLGHGLGGFVGIFPTPNVGFQVEGIYSSLNQKYKENDIEREINLKYFNIPLLLSLNTGKDQMINLNISGGPQFGISAGSQINTTMSGDTANVEGIFAVRNGDFGVAFGGGLDFALRPGGNLRLGVGYRGVRGLIDISDKSQSRTTDSYYILDRTKIRTNTLYAGISLLF